MISINIWILIAIIVFAIIFAVVAITSCNKKTCKTDYYALFIIGAIWLPFGFIFDNDIFFILGSVFLLAGLLHKDEWKKNNSLLKNLNKEQKAWRLAVVLALLILIIIGAIVLMIFENNKAMSEDVNNFIECVEAGNPVMESYPRQCEHNGEIFVEEIENFVGVEG